MTETGPERQRCERVAAQCFVIGIAGLPVWWLLGVASFVPLLVAAVLAWDLWTRRKLVVPPDLGWWLLFLAWVVVGLGTLWAAAPAAVDDGGAGRLLVFGYRLGWYLTCTVVLVWICNVSPRVLADRAVHRLMASVFLVAVVGGLLGVLASDLTVTTVAERILPGGLRSNGFVATLVSAETSDVQEVLGDPRPRPKAPFAFTNTWGSVFALTLVFFIAAVRAAPLRVRLLALAALVVAAVPVVLSLNRGLWLALGAGLIAILALLAARQRPVALVGLIAAVVLGGTLLTQTTLRDTFDDRLDSPHSNDRRSQLVTATVDSVTRGSPVVGFGSTRDVEGSFASIAGGATPDCPACGVPPLGTQGQLWLVLFSQGWLGALFFLAFFVLALRRTWRCRTTNQTVATFAVGIFLLQLTVYDTLGLPMLVVMTALGLAFRESGRAAPVRRPARRDLAVIGLAAILGGGAGLLLAAQVDRQEASTVTIAFTPLPTYLDIGDTAREMTWSRTSVTLPEPATTDTEAALLRSEPVLSRTSDTVAVPSDALRDAISISAPAHSTVLVVTVALPVDATVPASAEVTTALAAEYLAERRRVMEHRRSDLIAQLERELNAIDPTDLAWAGTRAYLTHAIDNLELRTPAVGEVVRTEAKHVRAQPLEVPVVSGLALGVLVGAAGSRALKAGGRR